MNGDAITPGMLADALGLPLPTDEQAAVIAAPPGPTLVVAGAGAGKTETMAARVVWMVANGLVVPDAVLGLTFTRKAAQQLTTRIRTRLARLAGSPLLREIDPSGQLRARLTGSEPEISTYHSYAGRLLGEHGLLLPVEPNAALLTETQLWQLAHRVVTGWDGDLDTDRTPVSVTSAVLALSGQLAEHLVEPEQLAEAHTELEKLILTLPRGPRQRGGPSRELLGILAVQHERVALLPLVRRLGEELRRRGALDFGAQMSLAARLAAEHPEVGAAECARLRLVLLDEYQDTGHAQRILLAGLFGDLDAAGATRARGDAANATRPAVTAVGDPMQSIYGWRGASAANLPRFATDFPAAPGVAAPVLPLLTSWRNPPEALDLANLVAEPLRHNTGGVDVDLLRARPDAGGGTVALALTDTVAGERDWVAERIAAEWEARADAGADPPTSAVLVRRNADAAPLAEALRARGLPVEIVGLGGLLATPEVADVVATLRLIADPAAGSAAVRILTGARWRLGVTDLAALSRRARDLSISRPPGQTSGITDSAALADALRRVTPEATEQAGLADAIADPGAAQQYSEHGYRRITELARELAVLRERSGQPLPELVAEVERTLGVGVEAQARRAHAGGGAGREHLDAFAEVVADYANDHRASLSGLLDFLSAAEEVENGLEPGEVEVARDRVQVLTVHAAKGLEWEVVAVPHVTRGVFPSGAAAGTWLGALAELPTALRGDRRRETDDTGDGVAVLDLSNLSDRGDLDRALDRHKEALHRRRLDEERRLFYVALTRTERALFISAHHWAETGSTPKGPSQFLQDLKRTVDDADAAPASTIRIDHWADAPEADAVNPFTDAPAAATWPRDPLGTRRTAIEDGAALLRSALRDLPPEPQPVSERGSTSERGATSERGSIPGQGAVSRQGSATEPGRGRNTGDPARPAQTSQRTAPSERSVSHEHPAAPTNSAHGDQLPLFAPAEDDGQRADDDSMPAGIETVRIGHEDAPVRGGTGSAAAAAEDDAGCDDTERDNAERDDTGWAEDTDPDAVFDDDPEGWSADVDALLAEHFAADETVREVDLPGQLPATALVELRADPAKLARRLRRPLPYPPSPFARRGTAFHAWLQQWFGSARLLGLDELPGAADDDEADADLIRLQEAFLSSPWADRNPVEVEVAFETSLAGTVIRGRMDAVFTEPDGRWLVLDWKTGAEPTRAEEPAVEMQLAVYRLAWARLLAARTGAAEHEVLETVGAAFHYVRSGRTIAPAALPGPQELAEFLTTAAPNWSAE